MRQQGAQRVGAPKVRYPSKFTSCGRFHARATGHQSVPFCPRLCLARQNGQQAGFSLLERKRWWLTAPACRADRLRTLRAKMLSLLLVAGLRLIRFSGGLSPVYGSDVFSVLHAFEVYAGDVVVCFCAGFFMCVAEGCHTKHSAA